MAINVFKKTGTHELLATITSTGGKDLSHPLDNYDEILIQTFFTGASVTYLVGTLLYYPKQNTNVNRLYVVSNDGTVRTFQAEITNMSKLTVQAFVNINEARVYGIK